MSRELKFRIWVNIDKAFIYFDIYSYPDGIAMGVSAPDQFTGYFDVNGKEIYENDIIQHHEYGPAQVIFGRYLDTKGLAHVGFYLDLGYARTGMDGSLEIIGNIYQK